MWCNYHNREKQYSLIYFSHFACSSASVTDGRVMVVGNKLILVTLWFTIIVVQTSILALSDFFYLPRGQWEWLWMCTTSSKFIDVVVSCRLWIIPSLPLHWVTTMFIDTPPVIGWQVWSCTHSEKHSHTLSLSLNFYSWSSNKAVDKVKVSHTKAHYQNTMTCVVSCNLLWPSWGTFQTTWNGANFLWLVPHSFFTLLVRDFPSSLTLILRTCSLTRELQLTNTQLQLGSVTKDKQRPT